MNADRFNPTIMIPLFTPLLSRRTAIVTYSSAIPPFTIPSPVHYHTIYIFLLPTTPVHHKQKRILSVKENTEDNRQTLHRATIKYAFPVNPEQNALDKRETSTIGMLFKAPSQYPK